MKEVLYFWLDFAEYFAAGACLSHLLKGMPKRRFGKGAGIGRVRAEWLMCLQYAVIRQTMSHASWAKRLIYGKDLVLASSKQSILPMAASMACTLLFGMVLYKGSRMWILSYVTEFYALMELSRFALYPLAVMSMDAAASYFNRLFWEEGAISQAEYLRVLGIAEAVWNVTVSALALSLLYLCVRKYGQALPDKTGDEASRQAAILFVPELLGLLYAVMLRSILFYYNKEVYTLIGEYPELNVLIPVLSVLCAGSILLSAGLIRRAEQEQEKRLRAEVFAGMAKEMKDHARDMESVYLQIRGMKHDMRHYIADVRALLAKMASGDMRAGDEVGRYMDSMQESLEGLDLEYQTGNSVSDVILGRYGRLFSGKDIRFSSGFVYPRGLGIDAFDIGTILNNGLSNAFEACENGRGGYVELRARHKGNMFFIEIENSFSGTLSWEGGFPVSKKDGDGHGLGLENMKHCAEKYYGKVKCLAADGKFLLTVMLQGRQSPVNDKK